MLRVCAQHRAAILEHTEIVDLCGISMHLITENTPLWSCTKMSESPFPMPYWGFCWPGSYALTRFIQENPEVVRGKRVLDFAAGCSIAGIASSQCELLFHTMGKHHLSCIQAGRCLSCATILTSAKTVLPSAEIAYVYSVGFFLSCHCSCAKVGIAKP